MTSGDGDKPGERRLQILQTLAAMLETPRGEKITTAALAARLDVSEAALYRHFASKAQMFEGLIEFIETTLFTLINRISSETTDGVAQAQQIVAVLLGFAEKNPGMTRVLIGDALVNEDERLQARMNQLYDRIEAALRQSLRIAQAAGAWPGDPVAEANVLLAFVVGRWHAVRQEPASSACRRTAGTRSASICSVTGRLRHSAPRRSARAGSRALLPSARVPIDAHSSRGRPADRACRVLSTRTSRHSIASASSSSSRPRGNGRPGDQLQRLGRLRRADDADQRREHAHVGAARLLELLAFAEQAVVAGHAGVARVEYRDLAVEANRRAGHQRLARGHAGAVDRVARGEVVGAVEDDVAPRDQRRELRRGRRARRSVSTRDFRIDRGNALAGGVDLGRADVGRGEQDLALQVGEIDARRRRTA